MVAKVARIVVDEGRHIARREDKAWAAGRRSGPPSRHEKAAG